MKVNLMIIAKTEEETEKYIIKNLCELPIHQFSQQSSLIDLLYDFDAVSFYPSAMSVEKSIYPRIETGFAFTADMNGELLKKSMKVFLHKEMQFWKLGFLFRKTR